jgi:hypothetical protein
MKNAYEHYISLQDDSQEQENYYEICAEMMDTELREILHGGDLDTNDKFLKVYCQEHLEKFNSEFIIN